MDNSNLQNHTYWLCYLKPIELIQVFLPVTPCKFSIKAFEDCCHRCIRLPPSLARMAAHLQLSGDNGPKMECRGNAIDGCSTHSVSQPVRSSSGMYAQTRLLEKKKPVAVTIHVSHNILNCLLFPRKGWQTSILPNFWVRLVFHTSESITLLL